MLLRLDKSRYTTLLPVLCRIGITVCYICIKQVAADRTEVGTVCQAVTGIHMRIGVIPLKVMMGMNRRNGHACPNNKQQPAENDISVCVIYCGFV